MISSCYFYFKNFMKSNNYNSTIDTFLEKYKNMQLKFLLGYSIFSNYDVTKKDFDKIIDLINNNKLIVGIYKENKMKNIYDLLNINHICDKYILNKTNEKIELSNDLKNKIIEINDYDIKFYDIIFNKKSF